MLEAVILEGRTVITIIADGGRTGSLYSLLEIFDLDLLGVTSFAARYSAYNPPLVTYEQSVRLSPAADGDRKAPYYMSGLVAHISSRNVGKFA